MQATRPCNTAARPTRRKPRSPTAPKAAEVTARSSRIGRLIALGSLAAGALLIVAGVGAIALLASEPRKRGGGGWNVNDLTNDARERLNAKLPERWICAVRDDLVPGARAFVMRQSRRLF